MRLRRSPRGGRHRPSQGGVRRRVLSTIVAATLLIALVGALVAGPPPRPGPASAQTEPIVIGAAHDASYVPALRGKRPLFILALGSDARPGQNPLRERADAIQLIGIDAKRRRATILGFPRDSWVSIPGRGNGKINTALTYGGPELMVRTIESLTGIRIDFWLLTSFGGLVKMVDRIGGVEVKVQYPMVDSLSGTNFRPGVRKMYGGHALAFTRDRHSTPGGDLGRSMNQGRLLKAALRKLRTSFQENPASVFRWVQAGWRNVQTDLSIKTLLDLALTAAQVSPDRVNNLVVPATTGAVGAQSVVFLSAGARSVFADMRADGVVASR